MKNIPFGQRIYTNSLPNLIPKELIWTVNVGTQPGFLEEKTISYSPCEVIAAAHSILIINNSPSKVTFSLVMYYRFLNGNNFWANQIDNISSIVVDAKSGVKKTIHNLFDTAYPYNDVWGDRPAIVGFQPYIEKEIQSGPWDVCCIVKEL